MDGQLVEMQTSIGTADQGVSTEQRSDHKGHAAEDDRISGVRAGDLLCSDPDELRALASGIGQMAKPESSATKQKLTSACNLKCRKACMWCLQSSAQPQRHSPGFTFLE